MEPALWPGDWLLIWSGLRRDGLPRVRPGQVVVARHPRRPDMLLVKRAARCEPAGWYLISDNPGAGAIDSRHFGPVPAKLIKGTLLLRYHRSRRAPATR
jgi:nickel-type superoxide dismutase maturation protease